MFRLLIMFYWMSRWIENPIQAYAFIKEGSTKLCKHSQNLLICMTETVLEAVIIQGSATNNGIQFINQLMVT